MLSSGNYVVVSPDWDNGAAVDAGAVTWGSGASGVKGAVSDANSLVGNKTGDEIGYRGIVELSDGDYVVISTHWDNGAATEAGAVTWGSGAAGIAGVVSSGNSLVGVNPDDQVGNGGVAALSDGDYVVSSYWWDNGATANVGAATWGSGASGATGAVSTANSLVGVKTDDQVGLGGVTALSNGNCVVSSYFWDNGATANAGAATWGDGAAGLTGAVSAANSLVGSTAEDRVGYKVIPLSNGNYVVSSYAWDDGSIANAGAATWGNGATGLTGAVTTANSLVGDKTGDIVGGFGYVTALSNGNYVVCSSDWGNGGTVGAGAATWGDGATGIIGAVSTANSLVGDTANDSVCSSATALSNGDYVVKSINWDNGTAVDAGAITWGSGSSGVIGVVASANSLVGSTTMDSVGSVHALEDGSYVVVNSAWNNGGTADSGAIAWSFGPSGVSGPITAANSVLGTAASGGISMNYAYDPVNQQLVVGRPDDNLVTLFRIVHGVMAFPDTGTLSGAPGATVSHTLQVTNTGDTTDSFDLALGDHDWTTSAPATIGPLAPHASQNVTVSVSVPAATPGGDADSVTVTITSQADDTKTDSAVLTTSAANVYGVAVTPAASAKSGQPGATVSYTLAVTNTGNIADSFSLAAGSHAWTTSLPAAVGPIDPGDSGSVTVSVTVPAAAAGGATDSVTITVTSQADAAKTDTAVLTTTASNVYGVTVTSATRIQSGMPGATVSYTLQITNTGNIAATFNLAASGNGWTTTVQAAVGPIAAGASQSVTVNVTVPASALGGSADTALITVTSQADNTKSGSAVLTTTAGVRKIYMPVMRK